MAKSDDAEAELYSVAPEEFVSERNELAKRRRMDGKTDSAKRVRKLPKPSVPAWAVNRASRDDPKAAKRLIASGEGLADAQRGVGADGGGEKLREAMEEHQAAVEGLMVAVTAALREGGHGNASNADRARETLRAAATDDELRDEIEAGTVARDREAVGFGSAPPPKRSPSKADAAKKAAAAERERKEKGAQKRLDTAERKRGKARAALDAAEEDAAAARRELDDLRP